MADLKGKTIVVTGATQGIGKETARALAKQGATVWIVGRNAEKTKAVLEELRSTTGNAAINSFLCDLSSLAEVRRLATEIQANCPRLDVLVNNAGGINFEFSKTADGYERTFATNHLAPFLLTNLLLPLLQKSAPARVVNLASDAHPLGGRIDFDNLQAEKGYSAFPVYGRSKLCNILFTRELAKRMAGKGVTTNAVHPGVVDSGFMAKPGLMGVLGKIGGLVMIGPEKGARTSIYLASSPEVAEVSGEYFARSKAKKPAKIALDDEAAAKLWAVSERLVGLA